MFDLRIHLFRPIPGVAPSFDVSLSDGDSVVIGRDATNLIQLPAEGGYGISRRHTRIFAEDGAVWVEDAGSKYGTTCAGRPVTDTVELQDGDTIGIGPKVSLRIEIRARFAPDGAAGIGGAAGLAASDTGPLDDAFDDAPGDVRGDSFDPGEAEYDVEAGSAGEWMQRHAVPLGITAGLVVLLTAVLVAMGGGSEGPAPNPVGESPDGDVRIAGLGEESPASESDVAREEQDRPDPAAEQPDRPAWTHPWLELEPAEQLARLRNYSAFVLPPSATSMATDIQRFSAERQLVRLVSAAAEDADRHRTSTINGLINSVLSNPQHRDTVVRAFAPAPRPMQPEETEPVEPTVDTPEPDDEPDEPAEEEPAPPPSPRHTGLSEITLELPGDAGAIEFRIDFDRSPTDNFVAARRAYAAETERRMGSRFAMYEPMIGRLFDETSLPLMRRRITLQRTLDEALASDSKLADEVRASLERIALLYEGRFETETIAGLLILRARALQDGADRPEGRYTVLSYYWLAGEEVTIDFAAMPDVETELGHVVAAVVEAEVSALRAAGAAPRGEVLERVIERAAGRVADWIQARLTLLADVAEATSDPVVAELALDIMVAQHGNRFAREDLLAIAIGSQLDRQAVVRSAVRTAEEVVEQAREQAGGAPEPMVGEPSDDSAAQPDASDDGSGEESIPSPSLVDHRREGAAANPHAAPIAAGLDWLADHQAEDGRWDADGFAEAGRARGRRHGQYGNRVQQQQWQGDLGHSESDLGVTGLALLAFLGAGQTHAHETNGITILNGLRFLIGQQAEDGGFGGSAMREYDSFIYCHSICTAAVIEAYALTGLTQLRDSAERALAYLAEHQIEDESGRSGWRYTPESEKPDSSATGWALVAIKAGLEVGLDIDPAVPAGGTRFLAEMTGEERSAGNGFDGRTQQRTRYKTGYTEAGYGQGRMRGYERLFEPNGALDAIHMLSRFFEPDADPRDVRDDTIVTNQASHMVEELPVYDADNRMETLGVRDYYYWYYGSLALHQYGGRYWRRWSEAAYEAVTAAQRMDSGQDKVYATYGSWDTDCAWGKAGGRVYATAINLLTLQCEYRYIPER